MSPRRSPENFQRKPGARPPKRRIAKPRGPRNGRKGLMVEAAWEEVKDGEGKKESGLRLRRLKGVEGAEGTIKTVAPPENLPVVMEEVKESRREVWKTGEPGEAKSFSEVKWAKTAEELAEAEAKKEELEAKKQAAKDMLSTQPNYTFSLSEGGRDKKEPEGWWLKLKYKFGKAWHDFLNW